MTMRSSFSDKFQATEALEALRGDKTAQEIAATFGGRLLSTRRTTTAGDAEVRAAYAGLQSWAYIKG